MLALVTAPTLDAEPACPGSPGSPEIHRSFDPSRRISAGPLVAVRRPFADIPRATWDGLAARTPWATPFAAWAFHRSWWDAYGATAHEQTLAIVPVESAGDPSAEPVAIVPLMHRHEVEDADAVTHTTLRHASGADLTPVEPTATAVFFGASYHADYATLLAAPADLPRVAEALVGYLSGDTAERGDRGQWDVVDLRRLRCGDPAADALMRSFAESSRTCGWGVTSEREDVCPVTTIPEGADFDGFLATLDKKERHEVRRKIRRAETAGEIRLTVSATPLAHLDDFIWLHQKRWGVEGLFPETAGGDCSRRFFRHLFRHFGPDGPARLTRLTVGDRLVASGIHFDDGDRVLYYNAGVDPDARDLSPGVVMVAEYVKLAIATGRHQIDFLRGNEPYKYEWGAVDEPIQRILVSRNTPVSLNAAVS
jgi:CelD/BcsL family acetyltransferase involved in cellulose biosynthesis